VGEGIRGGREVGVGYSSDSESSCSSSFVSESTCSRSIPQMSLVRFGNSALKNMKEFNMYLQFEGRVKYLELNYVNVVI
jgi:hypothetical protein